jgi:hypothetical protein
MNDKQVAPLIHMNRFLSTRVLASILNMDTTYTIEVEVFIHMLNIKLRKKAYPRINRSTHTSCHNCSVE